MAADLRLLPEAMPPAADLAVAPVRDDATAAQFCRVMVAGFAGRRSVLR
jgi:hypothetical protein